MIKKYLSRLLVGVTALVAVTAAQAGAIDDAVKRGTLRVGMDPTYMPFQMTNKRGEIIGFEVDILKAMPWPSPWASSSRLCPPPMTASSRPC
ncbi:hypothetical protein PshuTeo2_23540 [Pseudomonas hunanensis]|nr:hypothetical protein [Pseudomonas hunanensis]